MSSADWPSTWVAAWYASWSQLEPGNTMTANFMASANLDAITFDHRIREQLVGDLCGQRLRLGSLRRCQIKLEILALPNVLDAVVAQRMERVRNRAALRIEHRWLQRHKHSRARAA